MAVTTDKHLSDKSFGTNPYLLYYFFWFSKPFSKEEYLLLMESSKMFARQNDQIFSANPICWDSSTEILSDKVNSKQVENSMRLSGFWVTWFLS